MNCEVQQFLHLFTSEKQDEWAAWLPIAQFSMNSKKATATGKAPFAVMWSYEPRMGVESRHSKAPAALEFTDCMADTLEQVKSNMSAAQDCMKRNADRHRSEAPEYAIGDKVWLSTSNLRLTRASQKLTERWLGPYEITELMGPNAVKLRLPSSMRIHPVVNVSRLKPYKDRLPGQSTFRPGPVLVTEDRDDEYEVDYIVDSRYKGRCLEFLVHWKGYDETDQTWEPKANLTHAKDAISDFHMKHPSAPRALSMTPEAFSSLFQNCENFTTLNPHCLPFDCLEVDF